MMETNTVSPAKANTRLTSLEKKWVMYDVGNSAWVLFAATITPIYFNSLAGSGSGVATIIWGIMSSIVELIALFVCPIFGTMADFPGSGVQRPVRRGRRRGFLGRQAHLRHQKPACPKHPGDLCGARRTGRDPHRPETAHRYRPPEGCRFIDP